MLSLSLSFSRGPIEDPHAWRGRPPFEEVQMLGTPQKAARKVMSCVPTEALASPDKQVPN